MVGMGARRQGPNDLWKQAHAVKVAEQQTGIRVSAVQSRWYLELARHDSTRPRGVDYEVGAQRLQHVGRYLDAVAILDARRYGGTHEVMVDVRAEPVVVGDVIVGARGNEEALEARAVLRERASGVVAGEREATPQPPAEVGGAR